MNAQEAYELAESKGDITEMMLLIEAAAALGKTEVDVILLNDFQTRALISLGYTVTPAYSVGMFSRGGAPDKHCISWRFPDAKDKFKGLFG